jgi:hypothetical protein
LCSSSTFAKIQADELTSGETNLAAGVIAMDFRAPPHELIDLGVDDPESMCPNMPAALCGLVFPSNDPLNPSEVVTQSSLIVA